MKRSMYDGFGLFLFVICHLLLLQTNQGFHPSFSEHYSKHHAIISYDHNLFDSSTVSEQNLFFQNEPIPLAASVVDDLTTLASAIYIMSIIIIIFILLAWITHYNAPCSSFITSILSTITGLPEPIIQSVALCGSCCMWCESTWFFRRIHQFNIWISNKIKQFISGTCKAIYDTICPCCRPPDTPSNRSLIGSLPASIIAMINVPDPPSRSPPKLITTVSEPNPIPSRPLTVNVNVYSQPITDSSTESHAYATSNVTTTEPKSNGNQMLSNKSTTKKRRKQRRKRPQLKQYSAFDDSSHVEEQIDDTSDDDEEEDGENAEVDENTKIY